MVFSYWKEFGLYQDEVDRLSKLIPDKCYTDNIYMNAFIAISNLYYDVHNNGGSNINNIYYDNGDEDNQKYYIKYYGIGDVCKTYIKLIDVDIDLYLIQTDEQYLEEKVNEVVQIVNDKDLNYTQYIVYVNHNLKQISCEKEFANSIPLIFGGEKEMKSWVNHFMLYNNYSII